MGEEAERAIRIEENNRLALLQRLRSYRNNMTEFDEDEMDYLISLVEKDCLNG